MPKFFEPEFGTSSVCAWRLKNEKRRLERELYCWSRPPQCKNRAVQPVLSHRVMLKPESEPEGLHGDRVPADVVAAVTEPRDG